MIALALWGILTIQILEHNAKYGTFEKIKTWWKGRK